MTRRHHPVPGEAQTVAAYTPLAYSIAREFYLPGADREDVRQEALVGLLVAARDYDGSTSFGPYARLVIRRWLIWKVKSANRLHAKPLTESARVATDEDGEEVAVLDLIPSLHDTHAHAVQREQLASMAAAMNTLSPLERRWIVHVVNGGEYAGKDNPCNKQADNALVRARAKLVRAAA